MPKAPVQAYAPASIANVSLGYDLLGLAIKPLDGTALGDTVQVYPASTFSLEVKGPFADKLPADAEQNILTQCYRHYHGQAQKSGHQLEPCAMVLYKNLPVGSGLGSSASSVVAALDG